jgi:hypothetical protein
MALLAIKASRYVDAVDSTKTLRLKLAAESDSIEFSAPFLLTYGGSVVSLPDALKTIFLTNNMNEGAEIELLGCRVPALAGAPPIMAPVGMAAPVRDDLSLVRGIGPVYRQRLYDAGIETFAALAAASVEQLEEITRAHGADIASWIEQAHLLSSAPSTPPT